MKKGDSRTYEDDKKGKRNNQNYKEKNINDIQMKEK